MGESADEYIPGRITDLRGVSLGEMCAVITGIDDKPAAVPAVAFQSAI